MANNKKGFIYYAVDTNRYQDIKIKRLKKQFGCSGIAVYDYILCEIYREEGCFIAWDENRAFDVADYFGIKESLVNEIVYWCCAVFLFDKGVLTSVSKLTSHAIQLRYLQWSVKAKRINPVIPSDIVLLSADEILEITGKKQNSGRTNQTSGTINQTSGSLGDTSVSLQQSKVKESKVKESKEEFSSEKSELPPGNNSNLQIDFIDQIVNSFSDTYSKIRGQTYVITNKGAERSAAGKLLKIYKEKYPGANSDLTLKELNDYFTLCVSLNSDQWIFENMSLTLILSKFNQINSILKNGNKRKSSNEPACSDQQFAEIIAKQFGAGQFQ